MTNTNKLKGAIVSAGYTQKQVADKIGITARALNNKITNKNDFYVREMRAIIELLGIKDYEDIFFAGDVPNMEQKGEY